jgi:hypothetical protein
MAMATRDIPIDVVDHDFRQHERQAAAAPTLQAPVQKADGEALVDQACALRFTDTPAAETIAAFEDARPAGLDDPKFWLVTVRFHLHHYAKREPGVVAAYPEDPGLHALFRHAKADIEHGIGRFRTLVALGDRQAYPWALALLRLADWMAVYIHPRRHEAGNTTYPYRSLASRLYQVVLAADVGSLFAPGESGIRDGIEREVTSHARIQLRSIAQPAHGKSASNRDGGAFVWPIGMVMILVVITVAIELLFGQSLLSSALDLTASAAGLG